MSERNKKFNKIDVSKDIQGMVENIGSLEIVPSLPIRLQTLSTHLQKRVERSLQKLSETGNRYEICGPDWSRENPEIAGKAHAEVIVKTYGSTYALPNKYPEQNIKALASGNMDMYLIFKSGEPVGTACMVLQDNGWAELGRAASLGAVGNEAIQNLRILKWLTNDRLANNIFGLFSTCRTAPDRNVGTLLKPQTMRGGHAVTHIWQMMPETEVGGFGPLYLKHGSLEQFAYTFITNKWEYVPDNLHNIWRKK